MAISPVSASSSAVTTTQALRAQQSTNDTQRVASENEHDNDVADATSQVAQTSKPTVNTSGQTVGTIVNITA